MNNRAKLTRAAIISVIGILFCLATVYVPFLGLLALILPVPYAIISTTSGYKYALISAISSFFILVLTVDIVFALNILVMSILPGIAVGYKINQDGKVKNNNDFIPIYFGTISFMISTIVFFILAKYLLNIDLLLDISKSIKTTIEMQFSIMEKTNMMPKQNITAKDMINLFQNIMPTFLFMYSIIASFITYYVEVFILKRTKVSNYNFMKFSEFYLPGNAVIASILLNLLVMLLGAMNIGLYTDSIMLNIQMVFSILFLIQGLSVAIYFIKKWNGKSSWRIAIAVVLVILLSGSMILSFLGMIDSLIDFRKVRNYKST